ncbi:hypothetical protein [Gracilinema caldarium]|uniref:hypothetical protein n=1 Tax=Gracilinema caldarium TaxID=215591 RepID=UPI0026EBAB73|nr:hypothetical protein [Gracilinema caldarium]
MSYGFTNFAWIWLLLDRDGHGVEWSLLISGIRPPLWQPLVINSLIETNLGMPYIYLIHKQVTKTWKEDLTKQG